MSELDGKVALVTGASSGIGRATAELLVSRGARVVVCARRVNELDRLAAAHRGLMFAFAGDVADEATVEGLFVALEGQYGHADIVVNCAGMIDPDPIENVTLDRWRRMFAVNVDGTFLTCRRALPAMFERGSGAIVNVASISGVPGPEKFPGWASYCAAKAAVIGFTEALAVEVKRHGVRVNAISPGAVDTPMWAAASGGAPAPMTPAEVAETILFLATDRSKPMNGQNLNVYSA